MCGAARCPCSPRTCTRVSAKARGAPLLEPAEAVGSRRFVLPVSYTADASYHRRTWTVLTNYKRGFLGHYAHAGLEYRLPWLELRAGGRFTGDRWHPSGGVGFELSPGWHLDVGAFGTSFNPERKRTLALALAIRMERGASRMD